MPAEPASVRQAQSVLSDKTTLPQLSCSALQMSHSILQVCVRCPLQGSSDGPAFHALSLGTWPPPAIGRALRRRGRLLGGSQNRSCCS
jgi:hypothetical protein